MRWVDVAFKRGPRREGDEGRREGDARLAQEYGADRDRFEKESSFCIPCGLCVRYCAEIKQKSAVGFVERGGRRQISFIPEIASKECRDCQECFALCPTSYAQAAYFLTEALAFPGKRKATFRSPCRISPRGIPSCGVASAQAQW